MVINKLLFIIVEKLVRGKIFHIGVLSLYEISCGAINKQQLSDIEKLKEVTIIEYINDEIALSRGLIYQRYKRMGLGLATVDCLIMSTAQLSNFKILTRNIKHYLEKDLLYNY